MLPDPEEWDAIALTLSSNRSGGIPHNGLSRLDVPRDDRACSHHRALPDAEPTRDHRPRAERGTTFDRGRQEFPVALGSKPSLGGGTRGFVIDEDHAVADEDLVFDFDARADEGMALDLAVGADACALLNLHERPYAGVVTDLAAVKIRERVDDDVLPERHSFDEPIRRLVDRAVAHLWQAR